MRGRWIAAILTLVLGCSLAGVGTMAWFTSTAASNGNEFQSGKLEVSIESDDEIPKPLFKTSYDGTVYEGIGWDVGFWYPGKIVNDGRSLEIKNTGTMPLRICGISAKITDFRKNSLVYDFTNPNNNSQEIVGAYNEFREKMIISVIRGDTLLFKGSLKDLSESVQSLLKLDNTTVNTVLNVGGSLEYDFEAEMLTSAGNSVQGTSATVDLIMHATQNNSDAINKLLGIN